MTRMEVLIEGLYCAITQTKDFVYHKNLVIVGNNSTGKTSLVKALLGRAVIEESKLFYYIDSQNRTIADNSESTTSTIYCDYDVFDILQTRIRKDNIAQHDVFPNQAAGGFVTYSELLANTKIYSDLVEELLGKTISIKPKNETTEKLSKLIESSRRSKLWINSSQDIESLSSSEMAKIRIIMEVQNAINNECNVVIIDEFDIHFDSKEMVRFMAQLISKFSRIRFVFVIHNLEALVELQDMDGLIFIKDGNNEWIRKIDCNDISQIEEVHRLTTKYTSVRSAYEIVLSDCVSSYVKRKKISKELLEEYKKIDVEVLSAKEKILYNYLSMRINNADTVSD